MERSLHAPRELTDAIVALHDQIRSDVLAHARGAHPDQLVHEIHRVSDGHDVSLAIDAPAEAAIGRFMAGPARELPPFTLVAEGIGEVVGGRSGRSEWRVIVDPLDGSREMAKGRSAWILTGIARDRGSETTLADIVDAVQTEVPPERQRIALTLAARKGAGVIRHAYDLEKDAWIGEATPLKAGSVSTVRGGVTGLGDYFPGSRELMGRLVDDLFLELFGSPARGEAQVFFDSYICSGGCVAALALGQYRLHLDLRPQLDAALARSGRSAGLCAKPYDLCTALIAQEAGCVITTAGGLALAYPMDVTTDCGWVGYATSAIWREVEPALSAALRRMNASAS